jgi:hypothetical protein
MVRMGVLLFVESGADRPMPRRVTRKHAAAGPRVQSWAHQFSAIVIREDRDTPHGRLGRFATELRRRRTGAPWRYRRITG